MKQSRGQSRGPSTRLDCLEALSCLTRVRSAGGARGGSREVVGHILAHGDAKEDWLLLYESHMGTQPDWVQHAHARSIDGDAALRVQGVVTGVVTGVGTQMHSDAFRCTQRHSEALRGTQMRSEALRGGHLLRLVEAKKEREHGAFPTARRTNEGNCRVGRNSKGEATQDLDAIRDHQRVIRGHQRPSEV